MRQKSGAVRAMVPIVKVPNTYPTDATPFACATASGAIAP